MEYVNGMLVLRDDELAHYGVLGMKWGVRRYQNKDGTLTKAGKRRAQRGLDDARRLSQSHAIAEDMNRSFTSMIGNTGGNLIVPTNAKKDFQKAILNYVNDRKLMDKRYKKAFSEILIDNGEAYVYTLLEDKITGDGYESKMKLLFQEGKPK